MEMTPQQFKAARDALGLSQRQMGLALGYRSDPGRYARRYESGEARILPPVVVLIGLLLKRGLDTETKKRISVG